MFFREVTLPADVSGRLLISRLPGRNGAYIVDRNELVQAGVDTVVSLMSIDEIDLEAEEYAEAIRSESTPWRANTLILPDTNPINRATFWEHIQFIAAHIQGGGRVLVHCANGSARTGTAAMCILMALGLTPDAASRLVEGQGARPETGQQRAIVEWAASVTIPR
jgi:protein-tyrosine phosphatase